MLPMILKNNPNSEEYIFIQHGAPCNTSKKTQKCLEKQINFWSKEVRPHKSLDLNSMDFMDGQKFKYRPANNSNLVLESSRAWYPRKGLH